MKKTPFFDRKYLGRVGTGILCAILASLSVVYIGFHMSSSLKEGVDIMYAVTELIPQNIYCEGYILRDESVIEGSAAGALTPAVRDGARVRSGNKVADIYSTSSAVTQAKIALIEDQISFYEKCASSHISVGDSSSADSSLSSAVLSLRRYANAGDATGALSLKTGTVLDIRRLGVLTGKVTDYDDVISSLNSTLAALKASLGNVSSSVYAPRSGYYFSVTDGYEDIFSVSDIGTLTFSRFQEMLKAAEAREVTRENTLGKMVRDFRWYVACPMSVADAASLTVGKSYDITLENNTGSLEMELCSVLSNSTDAVAVFLCSRIPDAFDFTRCQKVTVAQSAFTGFCIPTEAMRVHEGLEGVFVLDEVTVDFRRVSISHEANGYFYCNAVSPADVDGSETEADTESEDLAESKPEYSYLKENDIIITSGTGLYVGMTLDLK